MRAGFRMSEERADFFRGLGREDVLELARLLLDLHLVLHVQGLHEQALGQAVAADDVRGPPPPALGEADDQVAIRRQLLDRKSTRLNSSHIQKSRMPSSA